MCNYGYVRVSTKDQNPERQVAALLKRGIPKECIYVDKMSGKDFKRPAYKKLVRKLKPNDIIIIKSIDRLGRNYDEILEQWRVITSEKLANIEVIDFPLLNTTATIDGLTGKFIADLVLQILAYVAQTEREFIHQRQAEGIAIAKANGVHFGRTRLPDTKEFDLAYDNWLNLGLTLKEAAGIAGMSTSTFYRRCKERKLLN